MIRHSTLYRFLAGVLLLALALPTVQAAPANLDQETGLRRLAALEFTAILNSGLFRTTIIVRNASDWTRLERLGIVILDRQDDTATVLVDDEQLETLARLRFEPQASDELGGLLRAQGPDKAWLQASLQPLVDQGIALQELLADKSPAVETVQSTRSSVRSAMGALTVEQRAALTSSFSVDDDADGLTNSQETWWCTDPADADTDDDGMTDGVEITALKDWLANRRAGPPGGTPWPDWPPQRANCPDKDHDSIPNLAERWDLGLNMDFESTDRDKFDDGQELFGVTYCPGGDLSCGYGDLPRSSDSGYVGAVMPSWVKAPGKHPLVAAYPVPEVDVVESSLKVRTVTQITNGQTITSGTEKSYSTAKTEGSSNSVANTQTWNDWEETHTTDGTIQPGYSSQSIDGPIIPPGSVTCPPVQGPPLYMAVGALCTGAVSVVNFCADNTGSYSDGKCARGAKWLAGQVKSAEGAIQSDFKTGQLWLSDALRSVRTQVVDIAGKTKDWIDDNLKLNSCSFGYPSGVSCEVLFQQSESDPSAGVLERSGYGTGPADSVGGLQSNQLHRATDSSIADLFTYYPMSYPSSLTISSQTQGKGRSWGGSQTNTHTNYEEHTITNGEAFLNQESWSHATAVDSAHAADLWFTYKVRNTGTEYAREIGDLAFNVYIGDDPNPVYTYFVGPDLGGDGKFLNFMPGEEHTYTARHIPLTLDQMRDVDLGGPIRVVVEDFTYGADELFYQDAANAGVLLAMEDGLDDGDEAIDTYLIPTWGEETVLDVLARYFRCPSGKTCTDADGMLIAIWTPEYRSDTPSWCVELQVVGSGSQRTLWCKHALSTADWWNVYTDGMGDGSEGFQDTPASPGQVALFRFNRDSDLDGYSDRSEERLGTDPDDAADYPRPELLAGVHSIRTGNQVVATLSLLNTGLYDAYGVEAVMIAPDDSVSITNNTVGGSGRVRAQKQVVVGSRIRLQDPLSVAWTQANHARPAAGGYYAGPADRTYTFTVQGCGSGGCDVGAGTWTLAWNDGQGASGSLSFASGYQSPTFLPVGSLGVTLALYTGKVYNGESFTVQANTPSDTFQYTINREPYTAPVVLVSYNDPQGNHRFVLPPAAMALSSPTADLLAFSGDMLPDPGVEIVTSAAFSPGGTTTNLVVNNPTETTLIDAHLFLEFVDPAGTVVSEVPTTVAQLPPGPTVQPVAWDSAGFDPAYDPTQDYIVMAFWTDYQGNILDTAARPLSSFQDDPRPAFAMASADEVWDFGTAQQGTLMQREFGIASTGFGNLLARINVPAGLVVTGPQSSALPAGDMGVYTVSLNTQSQPVGHFEQQIQVRTNAPENPIRTITIRGEITPMPEDAPGGAIIRPLDWTATIPGSHSQGEWVEFTHTLGPDPQTLHPVRVYSQNYGTLWGVGKYATAFGNGTASYDMFGDGRDGVMPSSGNLDNNNGVGAGAVNGSAGSTNITVVDRHAVGRINPGDVILIHQTRGSGAGQWELNKAAADFTGSGTFALEKPLRYSYVSNGGNEKAQILRVPQYSTCNVTGTVTPLATWNGDWGGILAVMCRDSMTVTGAINASGAGYRGGQTGTLIENSWSYTGEGFAAPSIKQRTANGNGGGGGRHKIGRTGGGGGGGSLYVGTNGWQTSEGNDNGYGGSSVGNAELMIAVLGGGGGGGGHSDGPEVGGVGGNGGGLILLHTGQLSIPGLLAANGTNGSNAAAGQFGDAGGGGGGAGGVIRVVARVADVGSSRIQVSGGEGGISPGYGGRGGGGSIGRIRVEYCESLAGTLNPPASTEKLNCYIAEQIETSPYDRARLNMPESFTNGKTYQMQYGRRFAFPAAGNQTQSIRMPKQLYATATLDALVSNTGVSSGGLTLCLDVGNNGSCDFTHNAATNFPATIAATGLALAINDYMVAQTGIAWGADIDVPVRVQIDRQADVLLTNLVLNLQSNQPTTLEAPNVDLGADRPLDWTVVVEGTHTQGEWVEFTHTLGPEPQTLHPVKVYSQDYATLRGVGKYSTDFSEGTMPADLFGDGRNGPLVATGNVTLNSYTSLTGSANANQGTAGSASGFSIGDKVLLHQTRNSQAGQWDLREITNIAGNTITFDGPLSINYVSGAQMVRVPQYTAATISGTITTPAWNGSTGGIVAFMVNGATTFTGGIISADNVGYAHGGGGPGASQRGQTGYQGGNQNNSQSQSNSSNGVGGGGGHADQGGGAPEVPGGGGGGGNHTAGVAGGDSVAQGGSTLTTSDLAIASLGGGGGGGGGGDDPTEDGGRGGKGGGLVVLYTQSISLGTSQIRARGEDGQQGPNPSTSEWGGGGGGAGGSILLVGRTVDLGSSQVIATGGIGHSGKGPGINARSRGGNGGIGAIHVEYCESVSGTTSPSFAGQELSCHIVEQVETSPFTNARLNLPESFSNARTYQIQYGRMLVFSAASSQSSYLRVGRRMYGTASLDVLVSNTGVSSGGLNLCLDIGNDGSCDFTHNATTSFPATLSVSGLEDAFNNYLIAQANIPWGNPIDVPVRVQIDRQADVMLTNLALTPVGAKTRFLRLPAQNYANVAFSVRFGDETTPAGALAYTIDVGADGVVDWSGSGSFTYPATVTSPNLAAAFNSYLAGRTGEVDVPIRITPSPSLDTALHTFQATASAQPDITLAAADIIFGSANPVEGDVVPVNITVHNTGSLASGPLVASVYATAAEWGEWYIGSAFVANVPAAGTAPAPSLPWNTLGFAGDVPVRVVLDPFDRVDETSETNNEASKSLTIKTRPDLKITVIDLSDDEPVAGETITVGMTVANTGQTAASASVLALYDGNPDDGGTLICEQLLAAPSQGHTSWPCPWTPAGPGLYRLFAVTDRDRTVGESNEGNNTTWADVYVGVAGPLLLDSGGPSDPPYTPQLGYGYLSGDASTFCGAQPEQSQRSMGGGPVVYRFDHLLPGHFYHLDVTLFECDGLGRLQQIHVDDNLIDDNISLADGQVHRLSYLLDPALYVDHGIVVKISELTGNDAVVAHINLHDIYYRYADAGGGNDPQYSASIGYGWLDGVARQPWGTLPYQTRRIDEADSNPADDPDNELRYQFDGLDPALRYQLHMTFYQAAGAQANQDVRIDGVATGTSVQVGAGQRVDVTVDVPPGAYAGDGSIVAQIVRSTAANAFANEIALEQRTVVEGAPPVPDIDVVPVTLSASQPPNTTTNQQFTISNLGDGGLSWSIAETTGSCGTPGDIGWASVNPVSGSTAASGSSNVTVTFNSTGLAPGSFAAVLCVNSNDPDEPTVTVNLALTVQNTGNQPLLDIPDNIPGYPNQAVAVPIPFVSNGASIASLVFSIDFDQSCLAFDPTDGDGDGIPDAVTFSLPPAFQGSVTFDASDSDGELDFLIADTFPPLSALPSGTPPATIEFMVTCQPNPGASVSAPVLFSSNPAPSFGSTGGGSVPGVALGGSVLVQATRPGDCNADALVDAGDISAVVLEIFDGDGSDPATAPGGTFQGSSVGCNANQDVTIDAGDISCTVLLIFNGPNACGGSLNLDAPGVPGASPALSLLEPKIDGDRMTVPIGFSPGDSEVSSLVFAVDYDPTAAGIDPTDADGNGIPDAIALNLPPEFQAAVIVDAAAGRLQVMIADVATPLAALPEQVIAQVTWQVKGGAVEAANLRLAESIRASFGDTNGRSVPGS